MAHEWWVAQRDDNIADVRYPGGRWQGFEWKQRNWTTQYNKRLVEDFSLSAYATLSTAAQISQLSSQFKSDQFCRYAAPAEFYSRGCTVRLTKLTCAFARSCRVSGTIA